MISENLNEAFEKLKFGEDAFHELMRWRIRRILLVLPLYDAWILEHDTKLVDQIVGEYHQLNLTTVPRLHTVSSGQEALSLLKEKSFDLVIVGMRTGTLSPGEFIAQAKTLYPDMPVLMLLESRADLSMYNAKMRKQNLVDSCFIWTGDSRLFLAMIKYVEDLHNAPDDTIDGRVGVLLVIEDSVSFYSAYLPLVYGEIMTQTQRLIAQEMNDADKYWRMRTRPKVLLAQSWEEAFDLGKTYSKALIGIVTDVAFPRNGQIDDNAGFDLIEAFKNMGVKVPVLFQSSEDSLIEKAWAIGAHFQRKMAGDLHRGIRRFVLEKLGFGDFIFQDTQGNEIHRAKNLREFEVALNTMPIETLLFHAERNDFSRWMAAHGESSVARWIRSVAIKDLEGATKQRDFLQSAFRRNWEIRHRGRLIDFSFDDPGAPGAIIRYGTGSLGGKGRGLAFFNALISNSFPNDIFAPISVEIPKTYIIATGEFDKFIDSMDLDFEQSVTDEYLLREFLNHPLDDELSKVLMNLVKIEPGPMAIRSSTLLEDSQSIPFAGVYATYMIPGSLDIESRYKLLCDALRLVWASTFTSEASKYKESLGIGLEEEKMAVVIQRMAGRQYGAYWFPRLSGTAQSVNYYPVGPVKREDGASCIAVGLGVSVVGGDRGLRFCPKHPSIYWSSETDRLKESQTHFWGINHDSGLKYDDIDLIKGENSTLERLPIRDGEYLKILGHMASTWDPIGQRIVDGIDVAGTRVVDYRDILSYDWLPLAPLLNYLLSISENAMGISVEIEFSLDWKGDMPEDVHFSLLQVRPLVSNKGFLDDIPERPDNSKLLLSSQMALGHGVVDGIEDVVWVAPELYDSGETESFRKEIRELMKRLSGDDRPAILIGPGRWGSSDRFLGIPVTWSEVNKSKLIVEVMRDLSDPDPSQGSHFFHNLVALGVGYAHVSMAKNYGFVNWDILEQNIVEGKGNPVRLSRMKKPLRIVMDGKNGQLWVDY